jgi:hypothetical protein
MVVLVRVETKAVAVAAQVLQEMLLQEAAEPVEQVHLLR